MAAHVSMETLEDEVLIWQGHPSWRANALWLLRWGALAIVPFIIVAILAGNDVGTGLEIWQWVLVTIVLLGVVLVIDIARRLATLYQVTTRRIRIRRGILSRHSQSTSIARLQGIDVNQSLLARMLGIGTVDFDTAGTEERAGDFSFVGVTAPHELVREVEARLADVQESQIASQGGL